jgi:NAD(P)-dependent dehydrogenase (short-subunit alcohol dehydrogenase family)
MKILITGSSGLIGSEVALFLAKQGCTIHGVDNNQRAIFFGPQGAWLVLDSSLATAQWNWSPQTTTSEILEEIAQHAEANPTWLDLVT